MSTSGYDSCNNKTTCGQLESCLLSLSPTQFTLLSSIIGVLLMDNLDINQQNSLGNFIVGIGQTILTAAAQGQLLNSRSSQNEDVSQELEMLKKQVSALEKKLQN